MTVDLTCSARFLLNLLLEIYFRYRTSLFPLVFSFGAEMQQSLASLKCQVLHCDVIFIDSKMESTASHRIHPSTAAVLEVVGTFGNKRHLWEQILLLENYFYFVIFIKNQNTSFVIDLT